jgi:hypothetical protein
MKEYLKKFIFFLILTIVAAVIFRIAFPKTMDVRIIGNVSTITGVSGIVNTNVLGTVNANVSGDMNANVSGLINTKTKVKF